MKPDTVEKRLKAIGYHKQFTVKFTKVDGTERVITGMMEEPRGEPKGDMVPIMVTKGDAAGQWRSFKKSTVLSLEEN